MDSSARSKSPPLSKVTQSKGTPPPLLTSRSKGGSSSFFEESSTKRAGGGGGGGRGGLDIDLDDSETAAFHNDSTVQSHSQPYRLTGMIHQHSSSSNSVKDRIAQINSTLNAGDAPTLSIIKSKKSSKNRDPDQHAATQRSDRDQYSIGMPASPPKSPPFAADWHQHLIDYRTGSSSNNNNITNNSNNINNNYINNNIIITTEQQQQQPSQEQREEGKYRKRADETPEEREARRQLRREHRSKQQQNELSKQQQQQNDCVLSRLGYLEHELDLHVDHRLKKASYETREEREEARRLRKKGKEGGEGRGGGGGGSSQKLKSKSTDAYCTIQRASSSSRGGQLLDDADVDTGVAGRDYKAALQFWQQPHLQTHNNSPPNAVDPSMIMRRSRSARTHSSPSILRRTQGDESYLPNLEGRSSSPVALPALMGDRTRSSDKPAKSSSRRHRDNSTAATPHHSPSNKHHHHHQQPIALQSPSTNSEALVSVAAAHEPYLEALLPASPLEGTGGLFKWPRTQANGGGGGGGWRCVFCTFVNPTDYVCCGACENYPPL